VWWRSAPPAVEQVPPSPRFEELHQPLRSGAMPGPFQKVHMWLAAPRHALEVTLDKTKDAVGLVRDLVGRRTVPHCAPWLPQTIAASYHRAHLLTRGWFVHCSRGAMHTSRRLPRLELRSGRG
jgi:hypothetical protein